MKIKKLRGEKNKRIPRIEKSKSRYQEARKVKIHKTEKCEPKNQESKDVKTNARKPGDE